jgi:hypothetical protein
MALMSRLGGLAGTRTSAPRRRGPHAGQRDGDLVRHTPGEEILRRVTGIVLEREHGDGRTRRGRRLRRRERKPGAERERGHGRNAQTSRQVCQNSVHAFALPVFAQFIT